MAITTADAKAHLNITSSDDDGLIDRFLAAAEAFAVRQLGFALDDETEFPDGTPADLEQAILMLVGHWYENREATAVGVTAMAVPLGVRDIINGYRNYTFEVSDG